MTFATRLSAICFAALLGTACTVGGDDTMDKGQTPGETPDNPDDPNDPTEPPEPPEPPEPVECSLQGELDLAGAEGEGFSFAQEDMPTQQVISYGALVGDTILEIQLWEGYGAVANGFAPGSYPIETDLQTCGVCAVVLGGFDGENIQHLLAATGGTLQVDAISATQFSGSLSGANFSQVDLETLAPVAGGCSSSVSNHSFDVQVEAEAAEPEQP